MEPESRWQNISDEHVRFELGDQVYECGPGEQVSIDPGYKALIDMIPKLAPQMRPVNKRIICPHCDTVVGHADVTGEIVNWEHTGPCGLPCWGNRKTPGLARTDNYHTRTMCMADDCRRAYCPRCAAYAATFTYDSNILRPIRSPCDVCNNTGRVTVAQAKAYAR